MRSAVTISLVVVGVCASFAGFLSLPVYGQWDVAAWGYFGTGALGAFVATIGVSVIMGDQ